MGRSFSDQEATDLQEMIGWSSDQILTYREWCGLCGATERLLGTYVIMLFIYLLIYFVLYDVVLL